MRGNIVAMSKLSLLITSTMMVMATMARAVSLDYGEALTKSILFYEGQRSGKLPPSQRMKWRKDSALQDGSDINVIKFYLYMCVCVCAYIFKMQSYDIQFILFIFLQRSFG